MTPRSPIDSAAANPAEKPTGLRNLGQIAKRNRENFVMPKLSANLP